ncbi:MAG: GNAT family N-acetyltransferase [Burkholderiales bacterium]|nr:MAG: GNAT family N-acetyltransferase [Burkholderiales bacterium]
MQLRPYVAADLAACLALFDSNVPQFFAPHERPEFEDWLRAVPADYLVAERDGRVVACGGWYARGDEGRLCWGLVDRGVHRQGVGQALLAARVQALRATPGVRAVTITTSQLSEGFFVKQGFEVTEREVNGLAPGLDRVEARLDLQEGRA